MFHMWIIYTYGPFANPMWNCQMTRKGWETWQHSTKLIYGISSVYHWESQPLAASGFPKLIQGLMALLIDIMFGLLWKVILYLGVWHWLPWKWLLFAQSLLPWLLCAGLPIKCMSRFKNAFLNGFHFWRNLYETSFRFTPFFRIFLSSSLGPIWL